MADLILAPVIIGNVTLDEKGRCCGRKPLVYKRAPAHRFCCRCDRAYDLYKPQQVDNWAWKRNAIGEFVRVRP